MKTTMSGLMVVDQDVVRERLSLNHNETLVEEDVVRERITLNHNETLIASYS